MAFHLSCCDRQAQPSPGDSVTLTINGSEVTVCSKTTVLEAAREIGVYIPVLCSHPNIPPTHWSTPGAQIVYQGESHPVHHASNDCAAGCGLCAIQIGEDQELIPACSTFVGQDMVVVTDNERIQRHRQKQLSAILQDHPHACLMCAHSDGCSRTHCPANIPENERCCHLFGRCELQQVAGYVGILDSTPSWKPPPVSSVQDNPLIIRDYTLCIGCTRCVRICREVLGVGALDFVCDQDGCIRVGTIAPSLAESGCTFCTACVQVCPTGALQDVDSLRLTEEKDIVPCRDACPAGIDIPRYLRLAAAQRMDEASAVVREMTPFPGILGRVCHHPCEEVCRRGALDAALNIREVKRCAAANDQGQWTQRMHLPKETGKTVAIVGAGPAGLTAAYFLRLYGHNVCVYESKSFPGGMLRYGIPAFRLPRDVIDDEIQKIFDLGVELKTNIQVGRDISLTDLSTQYDALFVAIGASKGKPLEVIGPQGQEILSGIDFLAQVEEGSIRDVKGTVGVVGGGNVALDVARTGIRLGATKVVAIFPESLHDMPANREHVRAAQEEGVTLHPCTRILRVAKGADGRGTVLSSCVVDWQWEDGRGWQQVCGAEVQFFCDVVITAIGQQADVQCIENEGLSITNAYLRVDDATGQTTKPGVFAGGDVVMGPTSVAQASASGRKYAIALHRFLEKTGPQSLSLVPAEHEIVIGIDNARRSQYFFNPRVDSSELSLDRRVCSFDEVASGLSLIQGSQQALRCLQCDHRLALDCNPSPPEPVQPLNWDTVQKVPRSAGVFQLFDPTMQVLSISGCPDLYSGLVQALESSEAAWFLFEENEMYSKKENELLQQYIQEHGHMPLGGDSDLDDLFD